MKLFVYQLLFAGMLPGMLPEMGLAQSNVPIPEGVTVLSNQSYLPGGNDHQVMDIYLPADYDSSRSYPVVLAVHGGGWYSGDKAFDSHYMLSNTLAALLNTKEYIVASANYSLTTATTNPYPTAVNELKQAVKYLQTVTQAEGHTLSINSDKIGAFGGSSGGNLVEMLGAQNVVCAVTAFCGQSDLRLFLNADGSLKTGVPFYNEWYFGGTTGAETLANAKAASPITYIDGNDSAFLLVHGTADTTVPYENSVLLNNAVKEVNGQSTLISLGGSGHDAAAFVTQSTLSAVVAFFHENLLGRNPDVFRFQPNTSTADYSLPENWEEGFAPGYGDVAEIYGGTNKIELLRVANAQQLKIYGGSNTTVVKDRWQGTNIDGGATVTLENATLTSELACLVSETDGDAEIIVRDGGILNVHAYGLHLGTAPNGTGKVTIHEGGKVHTTTYVRIGSSHEGRTGKGELTLDGGELTIDNNNVLSVGYAQGAYGRMTVPKGTVLTGEMRIGDSGEGILNLFGGSVTVTGLITYVAAELGSTGTLNVDGGTLTGEYLLVGSRGEGFVHLSSGQITAKSNFNIGVYRGGKGDVLVTGGTLAAVDMNIGLGETTGAESLPPGTGILTLMGNSTLKLSGKLNVGNVHNSEEGVGTLNLVGSTARGEGKWESRTFTVGTKGTVQFLADATGLPTLTVAEEANIANGTWNLGLYGAVAAFSQTAPVTILDTGNLTGWEEGAWRNNGLWKIAQSGNDLVATLDESLKLGTVSSNFQIAFEMPAEKGWLEISPTDDATLLLELILAGDGNLVDLAEWMNAEFQKNPLTRSMKVVSSDRSLMIQSFSLGNSHVLGWDFTSYNAQNDTSFAVSSVANVPEPETGTFLLMTLVGFLIAKSHLFSQNRRFSRGKISCN
ncbi:MAG: prolyl oligopeptidase family serine peptidase [Planctomycetia bacterium]|nr:prolyl oligopeptidase family serine peptidase [Planctomycetia bacterium]